MPDLGFARANILSDRSSFNAYVYVTVSIQPNAEALRKRAPLSCGCTVMEKTSRAATELAALE